MDPVEDPDWVPSQQLHPFCRAWNHMSVAPGPPYKKSRLEASASSCSLRHLGAASFCARGWFSLPLSKKEDKKCLDLVKNFHAVDLSERINRAFPSIQYLSAPIPMQAATPERHQARSPANMCPEWHKQYFLLTSLSYIHSLLVLLLAWRVSCRFS